MAAMERLSYAPLIAHLQQQSGLYNQLYLEHELKYGPVDRYLMHNWIVQVIEPIIREVSSENPESLPLVFKTFYAELLSLLGNGCIYSYEQEYKECWLLCKKIPHLVRRAPVKIIKALTSALRTIRTFQPGKTHEWISLLEQAAAYCTSVDQFLHCGRIIAWFCGLAHLRDRCLKIFSELPPGIKETLLRYCPIPVNTETTLAERWPQVQLPAFKGEAGGFLGYGGPFTKPPKIALINNSIFATDDATSYAFFADCFGKLFLPGVPLSSKDILLNASNTAMQQFNHQFGSGIITFDDISSSVCSGSTLVLSRYSSHYLFVYGWSANN